MKTTAITIAAAIGLAGFAYANETPVLLTDTEMDNVVAAGVVEAILTNPVTGDPLFEAKSGTPNSYTVVAGEAYVNLYPNPPAPPGQGMCNGSPGLGGDCSEF